MFFAKLAIVTLLAVSANAGIMVNLRNSFGKCLDVPYGNRLQGQALQVWDCNGGDNQQWAITDGADFWVVSGSLCLDTRGNGPGRTTAELWECSNNVGQKWHWAGHSLVNGYGYCLDTNGNIADSGTAVNVWDCNGSAGQGWYY
ncbi:ricin B lectin domain-containing protein [Fimicolochytrium jonesii]|uniref:ricin B lectin domain-containing protein n=1 Tax=Fimicolochytrium jonesii TaxID=1396493 RepID=UPI0022FF426E|nr:ricin B lectin domain-containing protein [Fimicolochytrium jonesii]KAI8816555.1 ricin B lectin domain-containing protein [Fimicolochytrium jonesii]